MTIPVNGLSKHKILIADAGSTKTEWAFLHGDTAEPIRFSEEGINALFTDKAMLHEAFGSIASRLNSEPDEIYFYGAGCATPEICDKVTVSLRSLFPNAKSEAHSDMTGAARSLFRHRRGVAAILGTGSNSALYDGERIIGNIPPLGYILGDEGSGSALGKRLIKEIFKGQVDQELKEKFFQECNLSLPEILEKTYRRPAANKFLASLVPFIRKHADEPFIHRMAKEEFREFFRRNVALYPDVHDLPVSFTGSVAYYFSDILMEAAAEECFRIGDIISAPMDGLIAYHLS